MGGKLGQRLIDIFLSYRCHCAELRRSSYRRSVHAGLLRPACYLAVRYGRGFAPMRQLCVKGALARCVEKRLARYAQFYSRVGFVHAYRPLTDTEVQFLLLHHGPQLGATFDQADFTDREALAAIRRVTGGNFRLLQRLLAQIRRLLAINELRVVTKEVVEAARENLVIGTT